MAVDKKEKGTQKCVIKRKRKFGSCKNCLEATQLENKTNYLDKNKISKDWIEKNHKEFIRNNKSILKTQQLFKSERHNVFTEEINKFPFSSNDDKRKQSIDLIETDAYGTIKDLLNGKKEIKCSSIIRWFYSTINAVKQSTK